MRVRSVVCVALVASCGGWMPQTPPAAPKRVVSEASPNVVLITLDTVRADRLGSYGYAAALTDTIDKLAADGQRFSRAYSPLPLTIPSHGTMFTGRYPPSTGIRGNGQGMLEDPETTLAEVLQRAGWKTAASVAAFVTTRQWGFAQGFDTYFDDIPTDGENYWHGERTGDKVVDDAVRWVAEQQGDEPLFVWAHLYDAHFPFVAPEGYLEKAGQRPYDAEIAFVDDQVGRLVEAFAGEPTLFILAGDHGEGLGEHHELAHGLFVYDSTQHVPLILSGAGVAPGVVEEVVSLADITPTVLTRLGLELPSGLDGRAVPTGDPNRAVWVESWQLSDRFGLSPHAGVVKGRWKYIDTPRPELYDLLADPGETADVASAHAAEVADLKAALTAFGFKAPDAGSENLDPGVRAQLEAMGYVSSDRQPVADGPSPDPKDHTQLVIDIQRVERKTLLGEVAEATALLEDLIRRYPNVIEFRSRLASMYARQKRFEDARRVIEEALKIDPKSTSLRSSLAAHLASTGKFEEASRIFQQLAEEVPYMPRIRAMAVTALNQAKQGDLAVRLGENYLLDYPDDLPLLGVVGVLLVASNQTERGMEMVRRGATADTPEADVLYALAAEALSHRDLPGAADLLAREVAHHDGNLKAWFALARVSTQQRRWDEQLRAASRAVELFEREPEMHYLKVLALFNLDRFTEARLAVDAGLKVDPLHPDLLLMDANLLAKEGKREQGQARFEEAQAALKLRQEAELARAAAKPPAPPSLADNPLGIPIATEKDWAVGTIADEGPE
jgi:arylsulfatase A-like enzyme/tetratricopeptide (TPR) repeat protein